MVHCRRLEGHFADLARSPICSSTVEKCFSIGDMKLKEIDGCIAAEQSLSQSELSKTRRGPFLLKRCDIASDAKGPRQWRNFAMRESSRRGTREANGNIFQAEEDVPNPEPDLEAVAAAGEFNKRRESLSWKEPMVSKDQRLLLSLHESVRLSYNKHNRIVTVALC